MKVRVSPPFDDHSHLPTSVKPKSPVLIRRVLKEKLTLRIASRKYVQLKSQADFYMPNMSTNADRLEIRRRWDGLMPRGSGSVGIPNYASYPLLGEPIADDPLRTGPLFEASWTHALHCVCAFPQPLTLHLFRHRLHSFLQSWLSLRFRSLNRALPQ